MTDSFFMRQRVVDVEVAIDKAIEASFAALDLEWESWVVGLSKKYPNHLFWFLDSMGSVSLDIIRVKPGMEKSSICKEFSLPGICSSDRRAHLFHEEIQVMNGYIELSDRFKFSLSEVQAYRGKKLPYIQVSKYTCPVLWNWGQPLGLWLEKVS